MIRIEFEEGGFKASWGGIQTPDQFQIFDRPAQSNPSITACAVIPTVDSTYPLGADTIDQRGSNVLEDVLTVDIEKVFKDTVQPGFQERFEARTTHECWVVKVSDDEAGPYGTCSEIYPDALWNVIPPQFEQDLISAGLNRR